MTSKRMTRLVLLLQFIVLSGSTVAYVTLHNFYLLNTDLQAGICFGQASFVWDALTIKSDKQTDTWTHRQ